MGFLQERRTRRQFMFLTAVAAWMICFGLIGGAVWGEAMKNAVLGQERRLVSGLMEQGISERELAEAFEKKSILDGGESWGRAGVFLEKIGRGENVSARILPEIKQKVWVLTGFQTGLLALTGTGMLIGAAAFFRERDREYERAKRIADAYIEGDFAQKLCRSEEGALFRLFGKMEELALAFQSRSEAADRGKKALQDAVSDISHQLKTPLAALTMYLEIMEDEPENAEAVRRFAEKSSLAAQRMERLILMLLKVMRLEAGGVRFSVERTQAAVLVRQASEELKVRAAVEKKTLLFDGDEKEEAECDPVWTAEAVSNLIKNALDHTTEGGTVRVRWKKFPALFRIEVEDDGCGIAPEDLPHIFKRFYRSKKSMDNQGVGLGLALTKSIAEEQGGTLSVSSIPGRGSRFTLSLPHSLTDL